MFVGAAIALVALIFSVALVLADSNTSNTAVTVTNSAPVISALSFNGSSNLTLTEDTFVNASATMTITDANGCGEISSVTAQFSFASTTGEADGTECTYDSNICYIAETCLATTTGQTCSTDTVEYDCGFQIWYPARPTDGSSPGLTAALWYVTATTSDGTDTDTATNTSETIDIITLSSLNIDGSISYPDTSAGNNTGATNQAIVATSTGNVALDIVISGDVMCTDYATCDGDVMQPGQQKFDTTDQTYASLTNTLAATTSPVTIEIALATTSATTTGSDPSNTIYWGIAIPSAQPKGSYTGQNTFLGTLD